MFLSATRILREIHADFTSDTDKSAFLQKNPGHKAYKEKDLSPKSCIFRFEKMQNRNEDTKQEKEKARKTEKNGEQS